MMNKMKSAGVHIVKFLFILPLIAVLLVAFRKDRQEKQQQTPSEKFQVKPDSRVIVDTLPWVTVPDYRVIYDTVPWVTTPNSKGYLIDVIGVNGECTVVIKDKKGKEIERVTLNKWKEEKKYEEKYGEILPPPPAKPIEPVEPVSPVEPVAPVQPLNPLSPLSPLHCPVYDVTTPVAIVAGGINLNGISREYEITDKKATLKLLDGTIENYDLTNKKEKDVFEKKYGKIIHLNTNLNTTVATNLNTNVNAVVNSNLATTVKTNLNTNVNSVITIPSPKAATGNNLITTTVAPAVISDEGIVSVSSTTPLPGLATAVLDPYSYVINGKEDIIITITKNTTQQELEKFVQDMKAKGVELEYEAAYDKGILTEIIGRMTSGDSHSNFNAYDFAKLILAMVKKGDRVYFKVSVKEKEVI